VSKDKWYAAGLAFECTQCGNCCSGAPGYVWMTPKEEAAIARFLGLAEDRLPKGYGRKVGARRSLCEWADGDCIYLKREGEKAMCSIYPVRPLQCRTWPFWDSNLASPDTWNRAHQTCPGINRGPQHDFVSIEALRTKKPE
jgi:uncharacterized protein